MVIHINTYGHMQLDSLTVETILGGTVHVLPTQDQPLPPLLAVIITVNLELEMFILLMNITSLTHCGMVKAVLLAIHVALTLTNHGSIIS